MLLTVEVRARDVIQIGTRNDASRKHVAARLCPNPASGKLVLAVRSNLGASDVHKERVNVAPGIFSDELEVVTEFTPCLYSRGR